MRISLGVDYGNRRLNAASFDQYERLHELDDSSAIALAEEIDKLNGGAGVEALGPNDNLLQWDGQSYLVGSAAWRLGTNPTTGFKDKSRYASREATAAILTSAARLAWKQSGNPSLNYIHATAVMGVPFSVYSESVRANIIDAHSGDFEFLLNGRQMQAHIEMKKVLIEGMGAIIALGTGEEDDSVAIIDSGSLTTALAVFSDGMRPRGPECASFEIGLQTAMDRFSNRFLAETGRDLEQTECERIMRAYTGARAWPDVIYGDNAPVSISDVRSWLKTAIDLTGEEKNATIRGKWAPKRGTVIGGGYTKILHLGGGAPAFHGKLQEILPRAEIVPQPERQNARGYAARAYALMRQNNAFRSA